ncbi:MAG TPA: acylphosphatase [Xanthobacteraceae bacterium]|nr:acylphosphatase [Xanthobacteraceae bacterium]
MPQLVRRVVFRGRVQGVGFRDFVERQAMRLGVEGWVRNRSDGSVEAVLAGDAAALDDAIAACRAGPRLARVDAVDVAEADADALALRPAGLAFATLPTL